MIGNVYVLFDDKGINKYTKTYYTHDESEFKKLNSQGWGVYCSVNDFEASPEQMHLKDKKTKRNIEFLSKINALFSDIDIAKKGDGQTREEKERKKNVILEALNKICPPTIIIDTSNGLQPIWKLKDYPITKEAQFAYVNVINGIIAWSKTVGGAGDEVKDVTRILRVPGYNHMKEEPYQITAISETNKEYEFSEIYSKFSNWIPKKEVYNSMELREEREYNTLAQYKEIDKLDFQEVIIKAYNSVGRSCEFDDKKRVILDGRLTGTFQGKNGDRRYLASTSHEPFNGNIITSVADIQQTSNKEAYKWILETFNIKTETQLKSENKYIENEQKIVESVKSNFKHITTSEKILRGYEELLGTNPNEVIKRGRQEWDDLLGGIYGGKIYVIGANTGIGKSTFVNQVCTNIGRTGVRVVKYSLEDRMEDIAKEQLYYECNRLRYIDLRPKYDRCKFVNNEYGDDEFRRYLDQAAEKLIKENVIELDKQKQVNIGELVKLMEEECINGTKVFFIDHLHYFEFNGKEDRLDIEIQNVMHAINELARKYNVAVFLIAHYRNTTPKLKPDEAPDPAWFKDAASIKQVANVIIQLVREYGDDYTKFYITKLRGPIKADVIISDFNIGTYEYDFKKTDKQKEKESLYFN